MIDVVDHDIDPSRIKQIAEGCTTRGNDKCKSRSCRGRDLLKSLSIQIPQQQRPLRPCCPPIKPVGLYIHVAIHRKNVQEAIVVEINEAGAPSQKRNGRMKEAGLGGNVRKFTLAVVSV